MILLRRIQLVQKPCQLLQGYLAAGKAEDSADRHISVSYTHLDVYKRQLEGNTGFLLYIYLGIALAHAHGTAAAGHFLHQEIEKENDYYKGEHIGCLLYTSRCV